MAKYYGTLKGTAKTQATRTGGSASGIKATVQSYEGSLSIYMGDNKRDGNDPIIEVCYAADEIDEQPERIWILRYFQRVRCTVGRSGINEQSPRKRGLFPYHKLPLKSLRKRFHFLKQ